MSGTDLIVLGSVALAAVFALAWALRPKLRGEIEAPKHQFAAQVRQYDEACRALGERTEAKDPS
jgi:hypothetical protein